MIKTDSQTLEDTRLSKCSPDFVRQPAYRASSSSRETIEDSYKVFIAATCIYMCIWSKACLGTTQLTGAVLVHNKIHLDSVSMYCKLPKIRPLCTLLGGRSGKGAFARILISSHAHDDCCGFLDERQLWMNLYYNRQWSWTKSSLKRTEKTSWWGGGGGGV